MPYNTAAVVQYLGWDGIQQVVERAELSEDGRRGRLSRHVSVPKSTQLVLKVRPKPQIKNT